MQKDNLKIILASDHAGFELKGILKSFLEGLGYSVLDVGAHDLVPEDDFPVYVSAGAMKVAEDLSGNTKAIVIGGSGQGEAMMANRFPGVRASVWYGGGVSSSGLDIIKLSREHNDANILAIGARFVTSDEAKQAVEKWLTTFFSGIEKYQRRNEEIDSIE
jgi:ribose 5-phosphate isomerase B